MPSIYWEHKPDVKEKVIYFNSLCAQIKLEKSGYKDNLVLGMNQLEHPLIRYTSGFCHGISLAACEDILSKNGLTNTIEMLDGSKFATLEKYHASQCFLAIGVDPNCKNSNFNKDMHVVIPEQCTSGLTPEAAAKTISSAIKNKLKKLQSSEECALCLDVDGHYKSTTGHVMAISVTAKHYYFVDANFGVFRFDRDGSDENLNKFVDFLSWALHTIKYAHCFGKFSVHNFPQLEECNPIPKSLVDFNYEELTPKEKDHVGSSSYFDWIKDKINEVTTGVATLLEYAGLKITNFGKALPLIPEKACYIVEKIDTDTEKNSPTAQVVASNSAVGTLELWSYNAYSDSAQTAQTPGVENDTSAATLEKATTAKVDDRKASAIKPKMA